MKCLKSVLILIIVVSTQFVVANNQLGVWYSGANPDFKPYPTEHGLALSLISGLGDNVFVRVHHDTTDFLGSLFSMVC